MTLTLTKTELDLAARLAEQAYDDAIQGHSNMRARSEPALSYISTMISSL